MFSPLFPPISGKVCNFFRGQRSDDFRSYLRVAPQSSTAVISSNLQCVDLFRITSIAMFVQSSLNIKSRGAKFEIFCKHGAYLHYILCTVASTRTLYLSLPASYFTAA